MPDGVIGALFLSPLFIIGAFIITALINELLTPVPTFETLDRDLAAVNVFGSSSRMVCDIRFVCKVDDCGYTMHCTLRPGHGGFFHERRDRDTHTKRFIEHENGGIDVKPLLASVVHAGEEYVIPGAEEVLDE